jgi:hypothetical protein
MSLGIGFSFAITPLAAEECEEGQCVSPWIILHDFRGIPFGLIFFKAADWFWGNLTMWS